jgi:RNA polymerase sigma factor (sigma-70 family)
MVSAAKVVAPHGSLRMQRELVERAIDGDHDAFSELARASIRKLYAVARLILRDETRAEDATQEALVAAWRDLSGLRDPDRFEAWLHRVLVRECYRLARKERRRVDVEGQVRPITETADPSHQQALRDELERGFAKLPVDQRTVLVLHHYVGYSFPEIAAALGIPVGTAKSRVHRATITMRAALQADARTPTLTGGPSA